MRVDRSAKCITTFDSGRKRRSPMSRLPHRFSCSLVGLLLLFAVSAAEQSENAYGVDESWPMQHINDNQRYKSYMEGCYKQGLSNYEKRVDGLYQQKDETATGKNEINKENYMACNNAEKDRIQMNLNQPKEMQNYTHAGYAKVQTPQKVVDLLQDFWHANNQHIWPEFWNHGNTYVNHWEVPTLLLDIGRRDLPRPLTTQEYETIIQSVQDVLESWTNQRLVLTSAYGIRLYGEGAILAPHADRLPLVSSAIINIVQGNLAEPWALEVIGHDGIAHNITSTPSEMILYESASVIHGRPYSLKGEGAVYASLFVHFEPLYHTFRHAQTDGNHYASKSAEEKNRDSKNAFEKALEEQLVKPTLKEFLGTEKSGTTNGDEKASAGNAADTSTSNAFRKPPDYVWPEYKAMYDQRFYFEYNKDVYPKTLRALTSKLNTHQAASLGELDVLKEIARTQGRSELFKADHNGWRPIHEASRSGNAEILEYLLEEGAKVNERTNSNKGGSPLYWAKKNPKSNAKAIAVLEKHGGVVIAPYDKNKDKTK